jgi:uncharacterized membrane protein
MNRPVLPRRLAEKAEASSTLGSLSDALRPAADLVTSPPGLRAVLRGEPLGHALHPLLTDLPIGLWVSSSVLDLLGRDDGQASDRLLGLGILAAAPTALSGLADWRRGGDRVRRVGALHAVLNSAALALYTGSWVLRRRDRRRAGVAVSLLAGALAGTSGYLGGHMVFVLGSPHEQVADAAARTAPLETQR